MRKALLLLYLLSYLFLIESWVAVEAGGETGTMQPKSLSHVKSEEEITQMLAEAVTEERKDPVPIIRQQETTKTNIR